jgi:L-ascorbate metabolism protein UlaG (beta-lactamase superfamily)
MHRMGAIAAVVLVPLLVGLPARAAETTLTWHGHAAFEIVTPKGRVLMIDPWLKNPVNPNAKNGKDPLENVARLDYILLTHGHFDHVGDAVALAKKTGARLVTNFELGSNLAKLHGYPKEQMGFDSLMNIGGEITIAEGEVTVALVPAIHSSGLNDPYAGEKDPDIAYGGNPAGVVVRIQNGPTLYHTGDTAFFKDMSLIGELYEPDVALINTGGHFGMEPYMAARAAKTVRARLVIPHHYGTFPVLAQDTKRFVEQLQRLGVSYKVMAPGSSLTFKGARPVND